MQERTESLLGEGGLRFMRGKEMLEAVGYVEPNLIEKGEKIFAHKNKQWFIEPETPHQYQGPDYQRRHANFTPFYPIILCQKHTTPP